MKHVVRMADQIAASDASIMITGESGVGKEVLARYVHKKSKRKDKPFIAVNCAAIPENLLESELFGHEKGAFTGAIARRIGKFEEADGGTLLLDEISEMDCACRRSCCAPCRNARSTASAAQSRCRSTSACSPPRTATSGTLVRNGEFREDLLYRLNVVNLRIPPLRDRREDLAALSHFFIEKYARSNGRPARKLSREALAQVMEHRWPGNVRELENAMHRAVLLASGENVGPDAIRAPDGMPVGHRDSTGDAIEAAQAAARNLVGRTVAEVEQDLILETLTHCLGNRTHAAHILGISIRTLRNKLKQYSDEGVRILPPPTGQAA
jgi:two-component system response regulator FlrC